jgi:hypothetical protein
MQKDEKEEQEKARAQRRSEAWKAEQSELEQAIAADAEDARRAKEAAQAHKPLESTRAHGSRLVFTVLLGVLVLLLGERMLIEQRLETCLNPRVPHNYGCADILAGSFWIWLLPSNLIDELHAAQEAFHRD